MAAGATYEPIATTTLGSASATITFSSIPNTYTDLKLVLTATSSTNGISHFMRFNSDNGSNYSSTLLYGNGSTTATTTVTNWSFIYLNLSSNGLSSTVSQFFEIDIFSYANNKYKTTLLKTSEDINGTGGAVGISANLWMSTSVINSITLTTSSSTYAAGTTATLYGIKAA